MVFIFALSLACYREPSVEQKAWALATTAVLFETNGDRHDILGGREKTPENMNVWKNSLIEWWGIRNRQDLYGMLRWLDMSGHRRSFDKMSKIMTTFKTEAAFDSMVASLMDEERKNQWKVIRWYWYQNGEKSILAWDYGRYIALCRWGYLVGYLDEKEAWALIMPIARLLQKKFKSWDDLGENYLTGRHFWSLKHFNDTGWYYFQAKKKLLEDPKSPWRTIPWDLPLD